MIEGLKDFVQRLIHAFEYLPVTRATGITCFKKDSSVLRSSGVTGETRKEFVYQFANSLHDFSLHLSISDLVPPSNPLSDPP